MKAAPDNLHSSSNNPDTRARILAAAAAAFGHDGMAGATTKEIARKAGVNEVTLFRHFHNKEGLFAAVLDYVREQQTGLVASASSNSPGDLRSRLFEIGRCYDELLSQHLPLIRTLLSEMCRIPAQNEACKEIFAPLRLELIQVLEKEHQAGRIRSEINPTVAADLFRGMIFSGVLKRDLSAPLIEYSQAEYFETSLDIFLRGIQVDAPEGSANQ